MTQDHTRFQSMIGLTAAFMLGSTAALSSGPAVAQDQEVVLAGYGGTIEQFFRDTVIPAFEEETGIRINYVVGTALSNYSKVMATRSRPEIDVYWANDLTHISGKQLGLYEELDPEIVTNLDQVFDRARDADNIGVASYVSSLGLQYNAKKLEEAGIEPPDSWLDLWNPEFEGRVALYTFGIAFSQDLVALLSQLTGGDETNIDAAMEKLVELRESGNIAVVANTPAEMDSIMTQEQAWVTYNVGLRALLVEDRGDSPLVFTHPKEGGVRFGNYFDVVKGAPNPEAAQKLVNFLISAPIQEAISSGLYVAPINRESKLPKKLEGRVPYGEDELAELIVTNKAIMNENLDEWAERWNREIEGAL